MQDDAAAAGNVHVLVLAEAQNEMPEFRQNWAELDQSLHFSVSTLRPGKYLAFAMQDNDPDLRNKADFLKALQSEAEEVKVNEKDHANVHLKLIPKDRTDGIRKRLGL